MPMTMHELAELEDYRGINPCPGDFDAFWDARVAEAAEVPLDFSVVPAAVPDWPGCLYRDLWFTGIGDARLHAKYICPTGKGPFPLVLQFHGYPGSSRSWLELSSFVGMGFAVVSMDCPGQGGPGQDLGGYEGTTVAGHIVAGLDGDPKDMYYVRLYQDICILCRIVGEMPEVDEKYIVVNGGSQGGAQGVACAALMPGLIHKAAILYPFLSDYQKVLELGADEIAYEGLRYYSRWFDPEHKNTERWFTQLGYIDTHNFAHRVRCPVLFGVGLSDTVCPPATQMAVYNELTCPKKLLIFPDFAHEEIQAFDDELINYFCGEVS